MRERYVSLVVKVGVSLALAFASVSCGEVRSVTAPSDSPPPSSGPVVHLQAPQMLDAQGQVIDPSVPLALTMGDKVTLNIPVLAQIGSSDVLRLWTCLTVNDDPNQPSRDDLCSGTGKGPPIPNPTVISTNVPDHRVRTLRYIQVFAILNGGYPGLLEYPANPIDRQIVPIRLTTK